MSGEYGNDFVTLSDEDGKDYEVEILLVLEIDGNDYAALLPTEPKEGEDPDTVYIARVTYTDDEEIYEVIEDDSEYERVAAVFEEEFEKEPEGEEEE